MAGAAIVHGRSLEQDPSAGKEALIRPLAWIVRALAPVVAHGTEVHVVVDVIGGEKGVCNVAHEVAGEG